MLCAISMLLNLFVAALVGYVVFMNWNTIQSIIQMLQAGKRVQNVAKLSNENAAKPTDSVASRIKKRKPVNLGDDE